MTIHSHVDSVLLLHRGYNSYVCFSPSHTQEDEGLQVFEKFCYFSSSTSNHISMFLPPQARVDEELLVYEVFKYFSSVADKHLNIRFRKVQHDLILKEKKMSKKRQAETIPETGANDHVALLRPFYDVSGYSGVRYRDSIMKGWEEE